MENATGQSSLVPPEERPRTRTTTTTRTIGQTLNSYPGRNPLCIGSQALRAWLRSARPSGTKPFPSKGHTIILAFMGCNPGLFGP